ncbi:hypothetical protein G6F60_014769 [Rhizopus arrhizus]|nr:hypothetical protein G6F60_014769 [Rhizopus arrhizus]
MGDAILDPTPKPKPRSRARAGRAVAPAANAQPAATQPAKPAARSNTSDPIQKRLQKIRPPRVQLTYDVEKGDAIEQKELPFVVGVMGDFSGNPEQPLPKVKDRKFVNVDLDNFDEVMEGIAPRAVYRVPNRISDEGGEFGV